MTLADYTGQPRVARTLFSALCRGRLAQAYIFGGPEGAGKRYVARELAKAVLCENGPGGVPSYSDGCGKCRSCHAIAGDRHPDVEFFRPEKGKTSYPVRQVREEIRRRAYLKPTAGSRRFLIIERAEALVRGGQNEGADTLLKLLEEPPADAVLVLLSAYPERLPDTVRSRCQHIRFDQPDPSAQAAMLAMEANLELSLARLLVRLAGGDLDVARGFLVGKKKDRLDVALIRQELLSIVRSAAGLSYPDIFALAARLDTATRGWPAFAGALGVLAALYRDAAIRATAGPADGVAGADVSRFEECVAPALVFPDGPEADATRLAASGATAGALVKSARRALAAQEDARRYPARLLLLEVLLLDLVDLLEETGERRLPGRFNEAPDRNMGVPW
jgi:DNA polymerase-3 subunit delta'